jgi:anaerobic dimethyl sulfoxide reductase subunit A
MDNCLLYSAKAIEPLHQSRNDYDIFCELANCMDLGDEYSKGRTADEWLAALLSESAIEDEKTFKETGVYLGPDRQRIGLSDFIHNPEANPLQTPSGKIEIGSEAFASAGFSYTPEVRAAMPNSEYPLRMITPHSRYRINSQNSNLPWAKKLIKDVLYMNPADGIDRGISSGDMTLVISPHGALEIHVELTEDIMRGCVSLTQGAWSKRDPEGIERGAAANSLTSTKPTLPSQGSRTHSVFVEVKKATDFKPNRMDSSN